jgi:hypothetical protein
VAEVAEAEAEVEVAAEEVVAGVAGVAGVAEAGAVAVVARPTACR